MRQATRLTQALPHLVVEERSGVHPADHDSTDPADESAGGLDDDRLRLVFVCCHPALSRSSRVALTLRLLGGLSTRDVAHAFLVQESTMAARITRAKRKIAEAHIPFRVPDAEEIPHRLDAVLEVVHLIFTTGHTAPSGDRLVREDLIGSSLHLARLLDELMPDDPRICGLLALILLSHARRDTRLGPDGRLALLPDQDRSRWDQTMIAEGAALAERSLRRRATRYGVQAAIAALHAQADTWKATDWRQIVGLYEVFAERWPSPVVSLNRAVALSFRDGPEAGLRALEPLLADPALATYPYLTAARADLLRRLDLPAEAALAYREALILTDNDIEHAYLQRRIEDLS